MLLIVGIILTATASFASAMTPQLPKGVFTIGAWDSANSAYVKLTGEVTTNDNQSSPGTSSTSAINTSTYQNFLKFGTNSWTVAAKNLKVPAGYTITANSCSMTDKDGSLSSIYITAIKAGASLNCSILVQKTGPTASFGIAFVEEGSNAVVSTGTSKITILQGENFQEQKKYVAGTNVYKVPLTTKADTYSAYAQFQIPNGYGWAGTTCSHPKGDSTPSFVYVGAVPKTGGLCFVFVSKIPGPTLPSTYPTVPPTGTQPTIPMTRPTVPVTVPHTAPGR